MWRDTRDREGEREVEEREGDSFYGTDRLTAHRKIPKVRLKGWRARAKL